ncbi:MAG: isoprenylcysteine carboxyl methyltransferase [Rhodospirillum sp.]|jgi:protein-S-isoprenylcysteine O-methyltransferase Ste14|nr:isoprenylcysteine carboxyl methyltransferase [Rhodospirillum sp.]
MVQRIVRQSVVGLAIMLVLLFVPAGTLAWPAGWIFLIEFSLASALIARWLLRHNPDLLAERMKPLIQRDQKPWDKALMVVFLFLWCAWFVVMALDAVRFGWSEIPLWLQVLGAIAIAVSMYIMHLIMRTNSFAAPVVKIQAERGHRVISDGPYAIVRHPMYGGTLLLIVGIPLLLGSWWGLALSPVLILLFAVRAVMEERTLMAELPGYSDYAARVRYRLVPFVW